jgi:hypothetical protein
MWRVRQITEFKEGTFPPNSLPLPLIDSPVLLCNRLAKQPVHILPHLKEECYCSRRRLPLPALVVLMASARSRRGRASTSYRQTERIESQS